jgi:biofilm PGA synthesis N-glycosyltransferase PgaC
MSTEPEHGAKESVEIANYFAVTPARDEEKLLPGLIDSMVSQTRRPARWIVIDDGSTDSTPEIIDSAARIHPWIEPHHLRGGARRAPGGESVVMQFLSPEAWSGCDFLFRVDADVSFGPDVAESLILEFARNPKLGIGGPILFELLAGGWREMRVPRFHATGAMKVYSRKCFEAIGGLKTGEGWDTVDEMAALMQGFETLGFKHIHALHHRPQGSARGAWRNRVGQGRAAYFVGYSPIFMLARAVRHAFVHPPLIGGPLMFAGYCQGYLQRWPRCASPEMIKFIRKNQVRRLLLMESQWR